MLLNTCVRTIYKRKNTWTKYKGEKKNLMQVDKSLQGFLPKCKRPCEIRREGGKEGSRKEELFLFKVIQSHLLKFGLTPCLFRSFFYRC